MSATSIPDNVYHLRAEEPALNPHDIAAEESILGGLLCDPNAIARIEDILTSHDFYLDAHKKIYSACLAVHKRGHVIDLITLESELCDRRVLKAVGGRVKVSGLLNATFSSVNIDQLAALVLGKSRRRSLILAGSEIIRLGHDTAQPLPEVMDKAESAVFAISQSVSTGGVSDLSEEVGKVFGLVENRSTGLAQPGIPTGFYDIDSMTDGLQRSDLIIVAARPAMGKTSLVLTAGKNIAKDQGLPVLVFSLEMSKQQLIFRLLSAEAKIDSQRLRQGRIGQHEWEGLGAATSALAALPILIEDQPMITVAEIRSKARQALADRGQLGCIIVDYLQLMGGDGDNRNQELAKITRSLKGLAREIDVPIVALSQLSRGVESRTNKRPMMSDLRESGALEQDADIIMMLYREEYYDPDTPDRGIAEVIITKHRNGPTGTVKLLFNAPYAQFLNRARGTVL